jgi:ABC-type transporter Mla maintaining outer membrane lipid asymmetry ATPase subunit MlaF
VESILGLRVPDAGTIRVLGLDPLVDHAALRERVGVQLQESAQPPKLRAEEALQLYASFYRHPDDPERLMETLGLSDKRETFFRDLSGGQKQRLSVALAVIGRPTIAVLDELTTGLDPQARRDTWDLIIREPDTISPAPMPLTSRGVNPSAGGDWVCHGRGAAGGVSVTAGAGAWAGVGVPPGDGPGPWMARAQPC